MKNLYLALAAISFMAPATAFCGPCVNPANNSVFAQCILDHGFTYCEDTLNCDKNGYYLNTGTPIFEVKNACCDSNPNVATKAEKNCFSSKINYLSNDVSLPKKYRREAVSILKAYLKSTSQFCNDA